jgi:flagellar hook-length control protein FliK
VVPQSANLASASALPNITDVSGAQAVPAAEQPDNSQSVRHQPHVEAPHQQVVRALRPLMQSPDGTYRVSLALSPEHLGDVEVHLELTDGQMHVRLVAEHAEAREALRVALPELRQELATQGIQAGDLDVDDSPAQGARDGWDSWDDDPRQDRGDVPEQPSAEPARAVRSVEANQTLDVRM